LALELPEGGYFGSGTAASGQCGHLLLAFLNLLETIGISLFPFSFLFFTFCSSNWKSPFFGIFPSSAFCFSVSTSGQCRIAADWPAEGVGEEEADCRGEFADGCKNGSEEKEEEEQSEGAQIGGPMEPLEGSGGEPIEEKPPWEDGETEPPNEGDGLLLKKMQ
jgi:hypothetical protein